MFVKYAGGALGREGERTLQEQREEVWEQVQSNFPYNQKMITLVEQFLRYPPTSSSAASREER